MAKGDLLGQPYRLLRRSASLRIDLRSYCGIAVTLGIGGVDMVYTAGFCMLNW